MKNIHVFSAKLPTLSTLKINLSDMEGLLFEPLTDSQWSNLGFNPVQQLVDLKNGYRIDFIYSGKELPKPQIIEETQVRVESLGYEASKKEISEIHESVCAEFCARVIPKTIKFSAYYHAKKETLIFDCKESFSQLALSLLLKAIGSIETKTLHCSGISNSLTTNILTCLLEPEGSRELVFAGFSAGNLLVMKNEHKDVVRFKGDYPLDQIQELIESGYSISEINLSKDGVSFTLNDKFKIKGIKTTFECDDDNFEDKEEYDRHVQSVELELMVAHCECLRNQFDKQNDDSDIDNQKEEKKEEQKELNLDQDTLYDEAVAFVKETRRVSVSGIQRKFRIGYNRSARLVEQLEENNIVSVAGHNGAREVLVE